MRHGAQQAAEDRRGAGLWEKNHPGFPSLWLGHCEVGVHKRMAVPQVYE